MTEVTLPFDNRSRHLCRVVVYSTRRKMRAALRKKGYRGVHDADAVCTQVMCHNKDYVITALAFAKDYLTYGNIAHECLHACHHRLDLCGINPDDKDYEETLATMVGDLVDRVSLFLSKSGHRTLLEKNNR